MFKEACILCYREISDPICTSCYFKEVNQWLIRSHLTKEGKELVSHLKQRVNFETLGEEKCIICKTGYVSICYYCFFSKSQALLSKLNFDEKVVEDFGEVFNYKIMSINI